MARRIASQKLPPAAIGASIVEALRAGTEDVYPGPASAIASSLSEDLKGVERQFATLLTRSSGATISA